MRRTFFVSFVWTQIAITIGEHKKKLNKIYQSIDSVITPHFQNIVSSSRNCFFFLFSLFTHRFGFHCCCFASKKKKRLSIRISLSLTDAIYLTRGRLPSIYFTFYISLFFLFFHKFFECTHRYIQTQFGDDIFSIFLMRFRAIEKLKIYVFKLPRCMLINYYVQLNYSL